MTTFYFRFLATPSKSSSHYQAVKAAYANVYALGDDVEAAKEVALAYLTAFKWECVSVEQEGIETRVETCPSPDAVSLYMTAQTYGVAALFAGVSVESAGGIPDSN